MTTLNFTSYLVSIFQERPGADRSHEELQREIDDMIYSLRRKKHDLYRQNGMKYYITQQLMFFFCSFPNISFNLTDSNKTRQRKRRRLTESKKKLRERIMQYNDAAAEKIDIDAACSLSEDVILPWDVQGDGNQVFVCVCDFEIHRISSATPWVIGPGANIFFGAPTPALNTSARTQAWTHACTATQKNCYCHHISSLFQNSGESTLKEETV